MQPRAAAAAARTSAMQLFGALAPGVSLQDALRPASPSSRARSGSLEQRRIASAKPSRRRRHLPAARSRHPSRSAARRRRWSRRPAARRRSPPGCSSGSCRTTTRAARYRRRRTAPGSRDCGWCPRNITSSGQAQARDLLADLPASAPSPTITSAAHRAVACRTCANAVDQHRQVLERHEPPDVEQDRAAGQPRRQLGSGATGRNSSESTPPVTSISSRPSACSKLSASQPSPMIASARGTYGRSHFAGSPP